MHGQQLVGEHALEVGVDRVAADRMALQVLEHDLLGARGADLQCQQARIERFDLELLEQLVARDADRDRAFFAPVNNGRNLARATQAAARTLALICAGFRDNNKILFHGNTPKNRSEEHTSAIQSLMSISYAVFCLKKKKKQ